MMRLARAGSETIDKRRRRADQRKENQDCEQVILHLPQHSSVSFVVKYVRRIYHRGHRELSHQEPQHVCAVVREVTYNDYRTGQNDRRIPARETNLDITECPAKV